MIFDLNDRERALLAGSLEADAAIWQRMAAIGAEQPDVDTDACRTLAEEHAALLRRLREAH